MLFEMSTRVRWTLLLCAIGAFLVSAALFSSLDRRDTAAGTILIVATTLSGVLVHSLIRHQFMTGETVVRWRVAAFGLVIAVGVALILWWSNAPEAADGFGFWGGVLLFIGAGLVVAELRRSKWASSRLGVLLAAFAALLFAAVLVLMAAGTTTGVLPALAGGALLAALSLSLLSAVCNRRLKAWPLGTVFLLLLVGLILFVGMVKVAGAETGIGMDYLGPIAGGLLLLMVATASRSNGDAAIVIVGLMVFFAATPTPVLGPLPLGGQRPVMVALGDSFMSGEGADEYFEDTNVAGKNTCRRAPTAFAHRLVTEGNPLPYDLSFFACSGSKAEEVHKPVGVERTAETDEKGLNQVAQARDELKRVGASLADVPFVLLTIGGNDSFFGNIAKACLAPGNCSALGPAWRANLRNLAPSLREAYRAVQTNFPGVPILVVPYPIPLAREKGSCDWTTFTPSEHRFLYDFAVELNSVISSVVSEGEFERLHYVDTMPPALLDANLALCYGDPGQVGVNFFAANGVGGLIESSIKPTNWVHNSMHPNHRGHEAMRDAVQTWLDGHADVRSGQPGAIRKTVPGAPLPDLLPPADTSARCVDSVLGPPPAEGVRKALEKCTSEWTLDEITKFAAFPGVLLVLPTLSAWLVGLAVVRLVRIAGARLWTWGPVAAARARVGLE